MAAKLNKHQSEHSEQCALIEWAHTRRAIWPELEYIFAIPNGAKLPYRKTRGGRRYSKEAMWLKAEGLLPGASDIFLPAARGVYHGLFIEMKVNYNKPTDNQEWFVVGVRNSGYAAVVAWGQDEARDVIEKYMSLRPGERLPEEYLGFTRRK